MRLFFTFLAGLAAACSMSAPAAASTFFGSYWYSLPGAGSVAPAPNETVACTFESGDCGFSGDFVVQSGTNTFGAALPGNTSNYLSVPGFGTSGTAVLSLANFATNTLSFDLGSIDTYNSFTWVGESGFTTTVTGGEIISSMFGNRTSPVSNRRIFVGMLGNENISSLSFSSNGRAMEVDNIAFEMNAVPEPGTWMMIILGFGLIGFAMRRRQEITPRRVNFT